MHAMEGLLVYLSAHLFLGARISQVLGLSYMRVLFQFEDPRAPS